MLDTGSNPLLSTSNGFLGNRSVVFIASSSSKLVDVQFVPNSFLLGSVRFNILCSALGLALDNSYVLGA